MHTILSKLSEICHFNKFHNFNYKQSHFTLTYTYIHSEKRQIIHSNFRSTSATTETRLKISVISSRLKTEIRHHQPERFSSDTRGSRWFRWYPVSGTNGGTSVSLIEELMDQRVSVGACKIGLAVWRKRGLISG